MRRLLALPSLGAALGPLAAAEIGTALIVASELVGPDIQPLAERIAQITGGNAFLISEVIRELADGGGLPALALPETIKLVHRQPGRPGGTRPHPCRRPRRPHRVQRALPRSCDRRGRVRGGVGADARRRARGEQPDGSLGMAHACLDAVAVGISAARAGAIHRRLVAALEVVHPTIAEVACPYVVVSHLADAAAAVGDAEDVQRALDAAAPSCGSRHGAGSPISRRSTGSSVPSRCTTGSSTGPTTPAWTSCSAWARRSGARVVEKRGAPSSMPGDRPANWAATTSSCGRRGPATAASSASPPTPTTSWCSCWATPSTPWRPRRWRRGPSRRSRIGLRGRPTASAGWPQRRGPRHGPPERRLPHPRRGPRPPQPDDRCC